MTMMKLTMKSRVKVMIDASRVFVACYDDDSDDLSPV